MPTLLRDGKYRFYFVSGDRNEPPHVHVQSDKSFAKFWLNPVALQKSGNFGRVELRHVQRIVERYQSEFTEAWHEYFDG